MTGRRRPAPVRGAPFVAALAIFVGACGGVGRELAAYHDPQGYFSVALPLDHDVTPTAPQAAQSGPSLLAGVTAEPPAAASSSALGSATTFATASSGDETRFQIIVVSGETFRSVGDLALYFLTGDPDFDVTDQRAVELDGLPARLVAGTVSDGGVATSGVAAVFALSSDGSIAYVVAAVFRPGDWSEERSDLLAVAAAFRTSVPPGYGAIPYRAAG